MRRETDMFSSFHAHQRDDITRREKDVLDHVRTWHSSTGVGYRSACSQLFNCRSQAGDSSADAPPG